MIKEKKLLKVELGSSNRFKCGMSTNELKRLRTLHILHLYLPKNANVISISTLQILHVFVCNPNTYNATVIC